MQRFIYISESIYMSTIGESPEVTHTDTIVQTPKPHAPSSVPTSTFPSSDGLDSLSCFPPSKN